MDRAMACDAEQRGNVKVVKARSKLRQHDLKKGTVHCGILVRLPYWFDSELRKAQTYRARNHLPSLVNEIGVKKRQMKQE